MRSIGYVLLSINTVLVLLVLLQLGFLSSRADEEVQSPRGEVARPGARNGDAQNQGGVQPMVTRTEVPGLTAAEATGNSPLDDLGADKLRTELLSLAPHRRLFPPIEEVLEDPTLNPAGKSLSFSQKEQLGAILAQHEEAYASLLKQKRQLTQDVVEAKIHAGDYVVARPTDDGDYRSDTASSGEDAGIGRTVHSTTIRFLPDGEALVQIRTCKGDSVELDALIEAIPELKSEARRDVLLFLD